MENMNVTICKAELQKKHEDAVRIAHSLFERNKVSGSSANMSFRHGDNIYITRSGACFGTLEELDFVSVPIGLEWKERNFREKIASKEYPLHQMMYKKDDMIQAVIHTHSFYATLWSCMKHQFLSDCIPEHTPYLKMKLGTVGMVPYEKPGSKQLFDAFESRLPLSDAFLLSHHGPIVGGGDLWDAFYCIEELEESARIAWELANSRLGYNA